jgi:hypothetical protein
MVDTSLKYALRETIIEFNEWAQKLSWAKVDLNETASIIEELLADKKEEAKKQFKERASKLIQSKVEFDAFVKAKEKEILDAITAKKKEFNKQIQETFAFLENVDKLRDEYISSLKESEPEKEA